MLNIDEAVESLRSLHLKHGDLELRLTDYSVHSLHRVPTYSFWMLSQNSGQEFGQINLRIGSTRHLEQYAGHIGYGVHPAHRGHHYAARSVALLLPLALRHGIDPVWITCDPENVASRRSLEIAGAEFVEIVDVPPSCGIRRFGGKLHKCRYRISSAPPELRTLFSRT
ncbi:GNAT family N-acetyltransferase [Occallatibacter savannae]|uniref:GNAT family N-acetyltransferase n=1 Tax=Occallatibacter savannae TaxID=1002691 RepID=UPI000D68F92D|nr:GNAT family N-acetyltransferase [Occallatibacter savannae]